MVTVSGSLLTIPSFTMSCATYAPGCSSMKLGFTVVGLVSVAVLPTGTVVNVHWYVNASPSASDEPVPLSGAVWAEPASVTGGEFSVEIVTLSGALSA
ncbi:MAG: hypothetical protein KDJ28_18040 [Candidatus Competibacteraceae bacterium]|nr:hypothetical protein [Candidatus Competibacteraceae bacterium]